MDRTRLIKSVACAAAFGAGVLLLLPSTETKATWTSVHHAVPSRVYDQPTEPGYEQPINPISYQPEPAQTAPYERPDRWDDVATAREIRIAEEDRAYGDGYAWASDNDVETARECGRLSGPRAAGCRDFVASLTPAGDAGQRDF